MQIHGYRICGLIAFFFTLTFLSNAFSQISDFNDVDSLKIWWMDDFLITSGVAIDSIRDESGNGNGLVNDPCADCANKAQSVIELNGHPVARFDSSAYYSPARASDMYFTHQDSVLLVIVYRVFSSAGGSGTNQNRLLNSNRGSTSSSGLDVRTRDDGSFSNALLWTTSKGSQVFLVAATDSFPHDSTWTVAFLRYRDDGGPGVDAYAYKGHRNTLVGIDSVAQGATPSVGASTDALRVGRATGTNENFFDGEIALILGYKKFPDFSEMNSINNKIYDLFFPLPAAVAASTEQLPFGGGQFEGSLGRFETIQ